jgi:hypothetical protein
LAIATPFNRAWLVLFLVKIRRYKSKIKEERKMRQAIAKTQAKQSFAINVLTNSKYTNG